MVEVKWRTIRQQNDNVNRYIVEVKWRTIDNIIVLIMPVNSKMCHDKKSEGKKKKKAKQN